MYCIIQFLQNIPKEYIKDRSKVYLAVVGSTKYKLEVSLGSTVFIQK